MNERETNPTAAARRTSQIEIMNSTEGRSTDRATLAGIARRTMIERRFQGLDVGDRVHVKLIHTDVERGFIDFARG